MKSFKQHLREFAQQSPSDLVFDVHTGNSSSLKILIFDIKNLYHIDNSGSESFCQIIAKLNNKKIRVIISGFNKKKKGFKFDKNLIKCIKKDNIFISTNNALNKLNA